MTHRIPEKIPSGRYYLYFALFFFWPEMTTHSNWINYTSEKKVTKPCCFQSLVPHRIFFSTIQGHDTRSFPTAVSRRPHSFWGHKTLPGSSLEAWLASDPRRQPSEVSRLLRLAVWAVSSKMSRAFTSPAGHLAGPPRWRLLVSLRSLLVSQVFDQVDHALQGSGIAL